MYRRNYSYTADQKQRRKLFKEVREALEVSLFHITENDYPYNMKYDKPVRLKHYIIRYNKISDIADVLDESVKKGYNVQINALENKSVHEINHLHILKRY